MKVGFQQKLLLTFIALSVIPLTLLGTYSYIRSVDQIEKQTFDRLQSTLDQTMDSISDKLTNIGAVSEVLIRSRILQVILQRAERGYLERGQELEDYLSLMDLIESVQNDDYVEKVRLYMRPEVLYSREGNNIFLTERLKKKEILNQSFSRLMWSVVAVESELYPSGLKVVQLTRSIPDLRTSRSALGAMEIDVRMDLMDDILSTLRLPTGGIVALVSSSEVITTSPKAWLLSDELAAIAGNDVQTAHIGEKQYLVTKNQFADFPWTLIALSPLREMTQSSRRVAAITAFLALSLIVIDSIIAFLFSRLYTRRLAALVRSTDQVGRGDYGQLVEVEGNDEIAELQAQHNLMVNSIRELMQEVTDAAYSLKEAEYKALEAQINPHFLYNTLESLKWMAARRKADDVVSGLEALAGLYRFNLNRGREFVTLAEEVRSIEDYVFIQNMRFGHKIHLQLDIPTKLADYRMIKMILQPLVENSIYHGIHVKDGKDGLISVKASSTNHSVLILVDDDGVGIPQEEIPLLLQRESAGYGIRNVHQRLQLYYGPDFGLSYCSTVGKGTTVTVHLPIDAENATNHA